MTFAQVNEEIRQDNSEVKALRQEILRLRQLLQINGIQHSDKTNSNDEISETIRSSLEHNNHDDYDKVENAIHTQNDVKSESNWNMSTYSMSKDESDTDGQDRNSSCKLDIVETRNTSASHLHRITCEKIVNALGTVLVAVDSFLKNINLSPTKSGAEALSESSSSDIHKKSFDCVDYELVKKEADKWKLSHRCSPTHIDTKKCNNIITNKSVTTSATRKTETFTVPTPMKHSLHLSKGKSLSSLLKQRRRLHGDVPEDEREDLRLEEELKKARKNKHQKLQLRQWLLEKETKAENPTGSFYVT